MSPVSAPGGHAATASDATRAWHHLLRATFTHLPRELQKSREHRHALRRLVRHH